MIFTMTNSRPSLSPFARREAGGRGSPSFARRPAPGHSFGSGVESRHTTARRVRERRPLGRGDTIGNGGVGRRQGRQLPDFLVSRNTGVPVKSRVYRTSRGSVLPTELTFSGGKVFCTLSPYLVGNPARGGHPTRTTSAESYASPKLGEVIATASPPFWV